MSVSGPRDSPRNSPQYSPRNSPQSILYTPSIPQRSPQRRIPHNNWTQSVTNLDSLNSRRLDAPFDPRGYVQRASSSETSSLRFVDTSPRHSVQPLRTREPTTPNFRQNWPTNTPPLQNRRYNYESGDKKPQRPHSCGPEALSYMATFEPLDHSRFVHSDIRKAPPITRSPLSLDEIARKSPDMRSVWLDDGISPRSTRPVSARAERTTERQYAERRKTMYAEIPKAQPAHTKNDSQGTSRARWSFLGITRKSHSRGHSRTQSACPATPEPSRYLPIGMGSAGPSSERASERTPKDSEKSSRRNSLKKMLGLSPRKPPSPRKVPIFEQPRAPPPGTPSRIPQTHTPSHTPSAAAEGSPFPVPERSGNRKSVSGLNLPDGRKPQPSRLSMLSMTTAGSYSTGSANPELSTPTSFIDLPPLSELVSSVVLDKRQSQIYFI